MPPPSDDPLAARLRCGNRRATTRAQRMQSRRRPSRRQPPCRRLSIAASRRGADVRVAAFACWRQSSCIGGPVMVALSQSARLGHRGGHLAHRRRAPAFACASDRRPVQAPDARSGRAAEAQRETAASWAKGAVRPRLRRTAFSVRFPSKAGMVQVPRPLPCSAVAGLFGGAQGAGGRDDFGDERREVLRACVGVQDAGAQRLAAAEDGAGDEGAASRLNCLRQCAVELV